VATSWLLATNDDLDPTILTFNIWCTSIVALKVDVDGHIATHCFTWCWLSKSNKYETCKTTCFNNKEAEQINYYKSWTQKPKP
jgi:hypothetical protein